MYLLYIVQTVCSGILQPETLWQDMCFVCGREEIFIIIFVALFFMVLFFGYVVGGRLWSVCALLLRWHYRFCYWFSRQFSSDSECQLLLAVRKGRLIELMLNLFKIWATVRTRINGWNEILKNIFLKRVSIISSKFIAFYWITEPDGVLGLCSSVVWLWLWDFWLSWVV